MRRRWSVLGSALLLLAFGCAAGEATPEPIPRGPRYPDLAVGLAPFAVFAETGAALPDAAERVGTRLREHGVGRVVRGATAEPEDGLVRDWARAESLDAIVEGRLTQFGASVSLDVRLRRPEDGSVVGTFTEQAEKTGDLPAAIDSLTDRLLGATVLLATLPSAEVVASPSPSPGDPAAPAEEREDDPFGFHTSAGPLSINSDQLEAIERDTGARTFVFRDNVVATQGDLKVTCDRLEAHYVSGSKQPNRLVAKGNVLLAQGEQQAVCNEAEFDRELSKLICRGDARFREDGNELRGDVIEIDLENESVKALGRTRFVVSDEGATP